MSWKLPFPFRGRPLPLHLWFEVDGRRAAFSYLRKNGCSALKQYAVSQSSFSSARPRFNSDLHFLTQHQRIRNLAELEACHWRIAILREPAERAASAFRDKFVVRAGPAMRGRVEQFTGIAADDLTFDQFVDRYLARLRPDRRHEMNAVGDAHVQPQVKGFADCTYTHVAMLANLHASMVDVVGFERAEASFARPVHAYSERTFDEACSDVPAGRLHADYRERGRTPSNAALLGTGDHRRFLREAIYPEDADLVARIEAATRPWVEVARKRRGLVVLS